MSDTLDQPAPQLPKLDPPAPTLQDRIEAGLSSYWLPALGLEVQVVPAGGVPWDGFADG
jgi:hypothetical protein